MHADKSSRPDALIDFVVKFREFGIIIHDGGSSHIVICYCPWCGAQLPGSQRDRRFDELDSRGIDPGPKKSRRVNDDRWLRSAQ